MQFKIILDNLSYANIQFKSNTKGVLDLLVLIRNRMMGTTPEPATLQDFPPYYRKDVWMLKSDVTCITSSYAVNLLWNQVSYLEPSGSEA
ncbi:hypothetical protein AVEN_90702-1 [Araneus ventricosus]|uniref:Uncharacterized protein n=1 Tax=Araneus ventricosus TaxID=182803 RepID=A0A4Y2LA50_ARAVE|nr:hypothetical protein AVEN_90702-1 [Araneus ventricosus]